MASPSPPHVIIFPFMAQGHTLPLLDLSKVLSSRGLKVTIITTPSNAPTILPYINKHPKICLRVIPFPVVDGLPAGCENTAQLPSMDLLLSFLMATTDLKQPFENILREMSKAGCLPICVISDFFLGWTLPTCRLFGVPRLVFHGMGVLAMAICKTVWVHEPHLIAASDSEPLHLPGLRLPFTLTRANMPDSIGLPHHDDPISRFISMVGEHDADSSGVIVNSFEELEGEHVASLESFYRHGAKTWCVGPFQLHDELGGHNYKSDRSLPYVEWLDDQPVSASVIYVSLGTQAHVSDTQLDELALGLEMSGHPFILVIRSTTWSPPDGLEKRLKSRGVIVSDWVEQRSILAHRAIGGFLSHCGWNSVLESLSTGIPILAWPLIAEQPLNAMFVVEGLEAGMWVPSGPIGGENRVAVGCEAICDGVRELMGGEKGRKARERAGVVGGMARQAMKKGGSSDKRLSELIDGLTNGYKVNDNVVLSPSNICN
ncbi:hypothetical protein HHK36_032031 [Tetracentron sinense]|uniref:Glycosyltransferase n=1 Tax=Tetracentron sinense TaxID=13715 RepID=A0A834Y5W5_TETSI|nr:hypothetical protein HHK36_032031 [Tetracentron sinense]